MQRASDIGLPPSSSPSLNGLADTDSESAIFSSGLLAFLSLLLGAYAPFSSPRLCSRRSLVRFPSLSPRAHLFFSFASSSPSHSQPDPDLRLRSGQRLNFDSSGRKPARSSEWQSLQDNSDNLQCRINDEFLLYFIFFISKSKKCHVKKFTGV